MQESTTSANNQSIILTMSELITDESKKPATRGDVLMLAATTDAEFGKMRSWITVQFAKVDARFDKISSENTFNTNQLLRRNTFQVITIALSAFGVIVALIANIIR
jgi:hypothetical protein